MFLLIRLLINAGVIMALPYILPNISVQNFWYALIVALVLALINITLKPLAKLIALPLNILTLGLFNLIINAIFLYLIAYLVDGFTIIGFWPAFWGALIISVVNVILNWIKK